MPGSSIPGLPYHVTQRGNRRQRTFFEDGDYQLYLDLLAEPAERAELAIWSYCLMPNHVHVIAVPTHEDSLRAAFARTHARYTSFVNARARWTGHLWQGRYGAVVMDETHLVAAVRYVALNPVRAGMVERAGDWQWASSRALLAGRGDGLVTVAPVLERVGDFAASLGSCEDEQANRRLRQAETTGRPAGGEAWISALEQHSGRTLLPQRPGRKAKAMLTAEV